MSISTYAELKTAMANWLKRTDIADRIPEFITLAEAKIKRELRTHDMESVNSFTVDSEYENIPTGILETRDITLVTDPTKTLQYLPPAQLVGRYQGQSGEPRAFTVIGSQYRFGPVPDGSYTAEATGYSYTDLSDSNTTSWVLTKHPDLILYGSLMQAEPFLRNDPRIQTWAALYQACKDAIENADWNSALTNPTMRAD